MKHIFWILYIILILFSFSTASAQEVYLSVAGGKAPKSSGNFTKMEIHLLPSTASKSVELELFDGSLSNQADVIIGAMNTVTTYSVFEYTDYFQNDAQTANPNAKAVYTISLTSETQYANRWVTLLNLSASVKNGYIIVVSSSNHDDVNCFKLRAEGWQIRSNNLSLGLYNISKSDYVQILPATENINGISFSSYGEEDSPVQLTDSWGNIYKPNTVVELYRNDFGFENTFGLSIKGSSFYINNLAVISNKMVWWDLNSILVTSIKKPSIRILQSPGSDCYSSLVTVSQISDNSVKKDSIKYFHLKKMLGQGSSVEFTAASSGAYNLTIILESENQYFPKYMIRENKVTINARPVSKITGAKNIIAVSEFLSLSGVSSFDPERQPLNYEWYVNGELRSKQMNYIFSGSTPGNYEIKLVTDDQSAISSCTTDTAFILVRINAQPYGEIYAIDKFSREETVEFKSENVQDSDDSELNYLWSGPGIIGDSNKRSVRIKHGTAGKYSLSLTISDPSKVSNSIYKTSVHYTVNNEPKPIFTIPGLVAPRDKILLNASNSYDSDSRLLDYTWTISDGQKYDEKIKVISFENPGDYTVSLTINDNENVSNSKQSLTKSIHVNAPPVPVVSAESYSSKSKQKFDASGSFDEETEIISYSWNFGDGFKQSGKTVEHIYQKSGQYTVTLTVDDGSKKSNSVQSTTHVITINKFPVAKITAPLLGEPGISFHISSGNSYDPDGSVSAVNWLLNNIPVSSKISDQIVINSSGDHYLTVVVFDDSGNKEAKDLTTQKIHINHAPNPKFVLSKYVADANEVIVFDATSSFDQDGYISKYEWIFEDGQALSGKIVRRSFINRGKHQFTLKVSDDKKFSNSIQSILGEVLINSAPIIVAETKIRSNTSRILLDAGSSYDPDGHAVNVLWTLPNGTKINKSTWTWESPKTGRQNIILTIDDGQQLKSSIVQSEIKIDINRPVIAIVDSIVRACTGQTILFNSSKCFDPDGDAFTTIWNFDDGVSSSETNPAHIYKKPGKYSVELKLHDGFSEFPTVAKIPVIIEGSPFAVSNIADTTICVNNPITFDGSASTDPNGKIGAYSWDFGDGETAYGATATHLFSKAGIYNVVLNVIGTGSGTCSNISQANSIVRVVEGPSAIIAAKEIVSPGEEVIFSSDLKLAGSKVKTSQWEITGGSSSVVLLGESVKYSFKNPGKYEIKLRVTTDTKSSCNLTTDVKFITVNAQPEIVWELPKYTAKGDYLILDATKSKDPDGVIVSYKWYINDILTAIDPLVVVEMKKSGNQNIKLVVTDNSNSLTSQSVSEKIIYVNSKPEVALIHKKPVYIGETILFKPAYLIDSDEDKLTSTLFVNNELVSDFEYKFTKPNNTIKLIQNDNRGLSNSVDSIVTRIQAIEEPNIIFDFPERLLVGQSIKLPSYLSTQKIFFKNVEKNQEIFFNEIGAASFELIWKPEDQILKTYQQSIQVLEPLQFLSKTEPIDIEWNPSNPEINLTMPKINRDKNSPVEIIWESGGKLLGIGESVVVRLKKGINTVTVKCKDQNLPGSVFALSQFVIRAE